MEIEIRFNSKSSSQSIEEALHLAEAHACTYEGKSAMVTFESVDDPDVQKMIVNLDLQEEMDPTDTADIYNNYSDLFTQEVLARAYVQRGTFKEASKALDRVLEADGDLIEMVDIESTFAPLRTRPEYKTWRAKYPPASTGGD